MFQISIRVNGGYFLLASIKSKKFITNVKDIPSVAHFRDPKTPDLSMMAHK
jgi:hypothetical protein